MLLKWDYVLLIAQVPIQVSLQLRSTANGEKLASQLCDFMFQNKDTQSLFFGTFYLFFNY